jgi:hypothetical protein
MADDFTPLNAGTGGDNIDEEAIAYGTAPTTRKRQRIVLGGSTATALVAVINSAPVGTEYGLTTRPLPVQCATSSVTSVSASNTSVTLLATNSNRKMAIIFNESVSVLFLKFGTVATTSSYTVKIQPGGYYEFPENVYTGECDGVWQNNDANGYARITELS